MAYDRDLFIDTFHGVTNFDQQGLHVDTGWNSTTLVAGVTWWLDPQSKDFGEIEQVLQARSAAAKQLLRLPASRMASISSRTTSDRGVRRRLPKRVECLLGMIGEAACGGRWSRPTGTRTGDEVRRRSRQLRRPLVPGTERRARTRRFLQLLQLEGGPVLRLHAGRATSTFNGEPYLDDLTTKILGEFDPKVVAGQVADLQRYGQDADHALLGGAAGSFALAWPGVQNFNIFVRRRTGANLQVPLDRHDQGADQPGRVTGRIKDLSGRDDGRRP